MSASTYYNFLGQADSTTSRQNVVAKSIEAHRQSATSPESFTTSSSNSNLSLNHLNPSAPTSAVSSLTFYSSSSVSSTSSSSANLMATASVASKLRQPKTSATAPLLPTPLSNKKNDNNSVENTTFIDDPQLQLSINHTKPALNNTKSNSIIMSNHQNPQLTHSYTLHSLDPRPMKPFKSRSAYIEAMKEDLSEWLNRLYADIDLTSENFFAQLETGAIICRHANNVTQMGRNSMLEQATTDSGGSNDNSLTHESTHQVNTSLSSPSPECDAAQSSSVRMQAHNQSFDQPSRDTFSQSFSHRHRNSTTNSSISSIATNSSSTSKQRLSLSGPMISPRSDSGQIDWFRVKIIPYKPDARPGTFFARDNICQFILWCRSIRVRECLLFETDDLVSRKNEKSFILCLLEVARIGFKVGMPTPLIIQLEQEIDREIENDANLQKQIVDGKEISPDAISGRLSSDDHNNNLNGCSLRDQNDKNDITNGVSQNDLVETGSQDDCELDYGPKPQVITNDLLSLHEKVVQLLCQCTCATQFPMVRIGDGKYKVGDKLVIFVRILRRHIMVRVGGGWQELSEFLRQKDPCRAKHHNNSPLGNGSIHEHFATSLCSPSTTSIGSRKTSLNSRIPTICNDSSTPRSRLLGSNNHLNKSYNSRNYRNNGGQKLISGSVSMSWLSNNS